MTTSKTIAALLGPTLVVSAVSVPANLDVWPALVGEAARNPALVLIAGYVAFVPGLAIVCFHNRWTGGWPVLVTVMGWVILISGFSRIVFPSRVAEFGTGMLTASPGIFPAVAIILLLIGGFLSFKGSGRERDREPTRISGPRNPCRSRPADTRVGFRHRRMRSRTSRGRRRSRDLRGTRRSP